MIMTLFRKIGLVMFAALVIIAGEEFGERLSVTGVDSLISSANARVGRPLTPVSVAGVARRTARRCAAGVYYC
jgi:hypothetical protein